MTYTFSSFDLSSSTSLTDWRQSLEESYRGRTMHTFKSGQIIPMYPHEVWVVCRGVVQLNTLHPCGDEVLVGFAVQAMPFGLPLTNLNPYQAVALSDIDLMRFTITELEQSPQLYQGILQHLNRRLQQTEALLALVSNKRVEERLRQILLLLKQEIGVSVEGGSRLTVRLTHQHLASAISSTRVTVTRAMRLLQDEGWLKIDKHRHIIIP
jgi:CRP-like cAMP-binding protein